MATTYTDALWQHIYLLFDHQLHSLAPKTFCSLSEKLAFIIRATRGHNINPAVISMPIIDLYNDMDDVVGRKLTLVEYDAPGRIAVLLEVQVGVEENLVAALQKRVDKGVEEIMRGQEVSGDLPTYQEAQGGTGAGWAE